MTAPVRTSPQAAVDALRRAQRRTGADFPARLGLLLAALDGAKPPRQPTTSTLVVAVLDAIAESPSDVVWLTLAIVSGSLPDSEEVITVRRAVKLDGATEALVAAAERTTPETGSRTVRLLRDATLVDLGDLVTSPLGTGIQRVARNVTNEWVASHEVTIIAWTPRFDALRVVGGPEREAALAGVVREHDRFRSSGSADEVVVPWDCTYVLPELAIQPARCAATQAMARFSRNRTAVIGFDCVPITSAETSAEGFAGVFALNLAAVAHFDAVGAISSAAAAEYEGWRRMLEGAGLTGPTVTAVGLPGHAPAPEADAMREAKERFLVPGLPLVLVVGSHEPRKNHLAVLHAAERLWRRGHRFSLTFIGGNSWGGEEFTDRLSALQGAGRPIESVSKLPDRLLWAAYRLARCTLFPSVNEGFGLPVAESLSAGTPAITSDFGSMREIAEGGGALLVNPRDDDDLSAALERMLTDDLLIARLRAEARARPPQTWSDYAERLWVFFHG
jgi:glycosyltransferase involved in cell wall biosynthesis